jgi:hypothetical protein
MADAHETVSLGWQNIWFGTGQKHSDGLFVVNPVRHGVNLNVIGASPTDDPDGLFEGTGKTMRHVKIRTLADIERPELRKLLAALSGRR